MTWERHKPRMKYLTAAILKYGTRAFSTQATYEIYREGVVRRDELRWRQDQTGEDIGYWDKMNCRNTFNSAIAQRTAVRGAYGIYVLDRVERGVYKFRRGG